MISTTLAAMLIVLGSAALGLASGQARAAEPAGGPPAPVAEVDGVALDTEAALRSVALQVFRLESQIHALRRKVVEEQVDRHLLAREATRRGLTMEVLLAEEVEAKLEPPSDAEVDQLLASRRRAGVGTPEEAAGLREAMQQALMSRRRQQQRDRYLAGLRAQAHVVIRLPLPTLRLAIPVDGEPALGPADALVTIVEFTDFQCPFCRQVQPALRALLAQFPGQIRLVHRDFPVAQLHPGAAKAAEAARCAGEQGKFWEYREMLYANQTRQSPADLVEHAAGLGLDRARFQACLTIGRQAAAVGRGVRDGKTLGVTGTPTIFVNGTPLVGARPLADFVAVVEQELARGRRSAAEDAGRRP